MEINSAAVGNVVVVSIIGNVFPEDVAILRAKLLYLVKQGTANMVLDVVSLNYLSSICLATLLDVKKKATDLGGDLKLARINKLVRNLLEATNLIQKIETFDTVDAAVQSFALSEK